MFEMITMNMLPMVSANDESIAPIGWPIVPLSRIAPAKRRDRDPQAQQRKPAPPDNKPKPG
jgi:hypothetical protein